MFDEVPTKLQPVGYPPRPQSYQDILEALDVIIQQAPAYTTSAFAAFPINYEFREVMCTESGRVAFLNEKVNAQSKKILNAWSSFFDSTDSVAVLNDDLTEGWFGAAAMANMPTFTDDLNATLPDLITDIRVGTTSLRESREQGLDPLQNQKTTK